MKMEPPRSRKGKNDGIYSPRFVLRVAGISGNKEGRVMLCVDCFLECKRRAIAFGCENGYNPTAEIARLKDEVNGLKRGLKRVLDAIAALNEDKLWGNTDLGKVTQEWLDAYDEAIALLAKGGGAE